MADLIDSMHGEPNGTRLILHRNRYNEKGLLVGMEAIKELASEDAVEVVRCKNCRYWDKTKYSDYATMGECLIWRAARNWKDFCSEGRANNE